ncbi:hypothetical protein [Cohnella soli]|uniref:Uncharacterized protein n=1 Tax=Cohnella soli TaxID=425005 RepID=A0ABW0HUE4_9BACL
MRSVSRKNQPDHIAAAYQFRISENQKLLEEISRLNIKISNLTNELTKEQQEKNNYRELYLALRQGNYLLIPK